MVDSDDIRVDAIDADNDEDDAVSELLPSTKEVIYRSIQRLLFSSVAAGFFCFLYLSMKRFVAILLGMMIGIQPDASVQAAKRTIVTSTSTVLPKP